MNSNPDSAEDDDDMGAFWRDVKAARQEKRANNRKSSAELLREAGVIFESKNVSAHLIVKPADGGVIDFWPGTGLWMVRGDQKRRYGVFRLIKFCKQPRTAKTSQPQSAHKLRS